VFAAAIATSLLVTAAARADVIVDWNAIATTAIVANAARPAPAAYADLAYVNVAMYDAVNGIVGGHRPYAVSAVPLPGANASAAAAAAAHDVLLAFYPSQQPFLDPALAMSLALLPAGEARDHGVAFGQLVASQLLALRNGDGRNAAVPFTAVSGPGAWQPTPPAFAAPSVPWLAKLRPFALDSPSQFRPDGPPSLSSSDWSAEFNEVKLLGSATSKVRSPQQTQLARFYGEHAAMQNNRELRDFATLRGMTLADNARFFATVAVSEADAMIACWDAKYAFKFWRPVTAIHAGGTDGNSRTASDAEWTPLLPTPNHPEYPSGHSCATAALAESLRSFFGTKDVPVTLSSTFTGTAHVVSRTDRIVDEVTAARIYAGFHYRSAVADGAIIGRQVASWVSRNYFQPVP